MNIKTILFISLFITLSFQQYTLEQLLAMTDQDLFNAGLRNQTGKCYISDARSCPIATCKCDFYAKISGQPVGF